jgi:hypothetical protein
MQYKLLVAYWGSDNDFQGCDICLSETLITPHAVDNFVSKIPMGCVAITASLEDNFDASVLWVAVFEVSDDGK